MQKQSFVRHHFKKDAENKRGTFRIPVKQSQQFQSIELHLNTLVRQDLQPVVAFRPLSSNARLVGDGVHAATAVVTRCRRRWVAATAAGSRNVSSDISIAWSQQRRSTQNIVAETRKSRIFWTRIAEIIVQKETRWPKTQIHANAQLNVQQIRNGRYQYSPFSME